MRLRQLMLAGMLSVAISPVWAETTVSSQQVDQLTDAVVKLMPIGRVMADMAAGNADWPVQDRPGALSPAQLGCLRNELSEEGYQRYMRGNVAEYLAGNGRNFDAELRILREATPALSTLMMAGVNAGKEGTDVDVSSLLQGMTPDQLMAMISFGRDPRYRDLRDLIGIGEAMNGNSSEAEGKAMGELMVMKAMFHGLKMCDVSPAALM